MLHQELLQVRRVEVLPQLVRQSHPAAAQLARLVDQQGRDPRHLEMAGQASGCGEDGAELDPGVLGGQTSKAAQHGLTPNHAGLVDQNYHGHPRG